MATAIAKQSQSPYRRAGKSGPTATRFLLPSFFMSPSVSNSSPGHSQFNSGMFSVQCAFVSIAQSRFSVWDDRIMYVSYIVSHGHTVHVL